MITLPRPKDDRILVAGDWHGSTSQGLAAIQYAQEHGIDTIIQLGDFGFYRDGEGYFAELSRALTRANATLYFIDGNHEDFTYLYEHPIDPETGLRQIRRNLFHLPRGTRWEWDGISFLALGGAPSIDLNFRVPGVSWWAEEAITREDVANAVAGGPVDVMFTHDSPATAPNPIASDPGQQSSAIRYFGPPALRYCGMHRNTLAEVTNRVTPRMLFHGHYHRKVRGTYVHHDSVATTGYVYGLDQGTAGTESIKVFSLTDVRRYTFDLNNIITPQRPRKVR